jgi:hypothetical protein
VGIQDRPRTRAAKGRNPLRSVVVLILILLSLVAVDWSETGAHSRYEAHIYSAFDLIPPVIDGVLGGGEWAVATVINLTDIPSNEVASYMYVMNNETHLFVAYDVVGDTSPTQLDAASLSFDGDHDGSVQEGRNNEFVVRAQPFVCGAVSSFKCHYTYSSSTNSWVPADPMDDSLPYHSGLDAVAGFGPSPRFSTNHRTYEFSIPLFLLARAYGVLGPGDTIGIYGGSHVSPFSGIWDSASVSMTFWPEFMSLGPNRYGDVILGTSIDCAIEPRFDTKPASPGGSAEYTLKVFNTGSGLGYYDLDYTSSEGWTVLFYDEFSNPLVTTSGGDPGLVDLGPILSDSYVEMKAEVLVPSDASEGVVDISNINVVPWSDPSKRDAVTIRTGTPAGTPWSTSFESSSPGWFVSPLQPNDWQLGSPAFSGGPSSAYSGSDVWGTNLSGNYSISSNSFLYSRFFSIPSYTVNATLVFYHWYDIVENQQDGGWVEVSVDGLQFQPLVPTGGYPEESYEGTSVFAGFSGGWVRSEFNISSYKGSVVCFRFSFWDWLNTGSAQPELVMAGWYLDDLSIEVEGMPFSVDVTPAIIEKPGTEGQNVTFELIIENEGSIDDTIDLFPSGVLGWPLELMDTAWTPLSDTESPGDGIPDTGLLPPGGSVSIYVNVTIPMTAMPGEIEKVDILARSSGSVNIEDNSSLVVTVAYPLDFTDDIEEDVQGWTADGFWHKVDSCDPSAPAWNMSQSGCRSWWYGIDAQGNYDNGSRNSGNLTTPPVDLRDTLGAEFRFSYWFWTDPINVYDVRWVLVRVDGNPWPELGESDTFLFWDDTPQTWLNWSLNLSSYLGDVIQIRLHFDTIDHLLNWYQGWYVDDVSFSTTVAANQPPTISFIDPAPGSSLTGGMAHDVNWTAGDDYDLPEDLLIWINYSETGAPPWSPIPNAQGIYADSFPLAWDVPSLDSSTVRLNATILDTDGLTASRESSLFEVDSTRPAVIDHGPVGMDVDVNASMFITFSEEMNASSVVLSFEMKRTDTLEEVNGTLDCSGATLTFTPLAALEPEVEYQVYLAVGAHDDSVPGNTLIAAFSWLFVTKRPPNLPPWISITYPQGGELFTGGSMHSISWIADDEWDSLEELRVWLNYSLDSGQNWASITGSDGLPGSQVSLEWTLPVVNSTQIILNATVVDTEGVVFWNTTTPFGIDSELPEITAIFPQGANVSVLSPIGISFSEKMNESSCESAFSLLLATDQSPVPGSISWSNATLTFAPSGPLLSGEEYLVNVSFLAKDPSIPGNHLSGNFTSSFMTAVGDITPPFVISTEPTQGEERVRISIRSIRILFSETMNLTSLVTALNITPSFAYTYHLSGNSIFIQPLEDLKPGATYNVRINGSVAKDSSGNLLDGNHDGTGGDDFVLEFTTEEEEEEWLNTTMMLSILVVILLILTSLFLIIYLLERRKQEAGQEEEAEEEEKVDVESELKEIDRILGIEEDD